MKRKDWEGYEPDPDWQGFTRRGFMKGCAALGTAVGTFHMQYDNWVFSFSPEAAHAAEAGAQGRQMIPSQCPYCGVGCATYLVVENGKVVAAVPDKDSPVNLGMQCIKGLTAHEALDVDRQTKVLIRKDYTDPIKGHVSSTKGRFDDGVFREATWEEAEELAVEMQTRIVEEYGGNAIGIWQSGQLTMEEQWIDNQLYKAVLQSNTIEANARMCMTSAVTGYFASLGNDHPPTCYEDIIDADFISHWGHNARGSHPVLYWRVAQEKERRGIPTMVVDPRYTGTMDGYNQVNPSNQFNVTIRPNGDLSLMNAIAYVILKEHPDAVDEQFIRQYTDGFDAYREAILARYSPEQVVDRTGMAPDYVRSIARTWVEASQKGRRRGKGGVLSFWGIGWNQSIHGQNRTKSIINLHLLTGDIGRPGAGPFSMTGQPNAMGERFMGGLTGRLPFNEGMGNAAHRDKIAETWGVSRERLAATAKLKNKGMGIGMFERAHRGEVKLMKLAYATHVDPPDTKALIRPALTKTFVIANEAYRHAPNNLYADIIFPAATLGEKGGSYMNSERRFYVTDKATSGPPNTKPDLDIAIEEGKKLAKRLGLDPDKVFPYEKKTAGPFAGYYDPEDVFRVAMRASRGTDTDMYGLIEREEKEGTSPYEQLRQAKGIQYPSPTAEIAKQGGYKRKYMGQDIFKKFPTANGNARFHMCEQDYSRAREICAKVEKVGREPDFYAIDHYDVLVELRDNGLTPEIPDFDYIGRSLDEIREADRYPLWLSQGIVFEHFHTAKTIRAATTRKLVPEQYVEMNAEDAQRWGLKDGEWVRVVTPRIDPETGEPCWYEARVSIGTDSRVKPARNKVAPGFVFSPWNLSVADSADPKKNKWLVNATSNRLFDPVSGQADYKHLKARIEKIET